MIQRFRHILLLVCCFVTGVCYGQHPFIDSTTIKQFLGDWQGTLTYLDYKSNKAYTMPADLKVTRLQNDNQLLFSHIYPNEPNANSLDTVTFSNGGKMINNELVKSKVQLKNGTTQIITVYESVDGNDNQPATIRHTYTLGTSTFVVRKDVRFNGQLVWIKRNEYSYSRK